MERKSIARWILIAAFVIVLGWFGIDKFRNPILWIGFLPLWIDGVLGLSRDGWLQVAGAAEILSAALLLVPIRRLRQIVVALIALHLLHIITMVVGWNDIGVRDAGLLLSSLALLLLL